MKNIFLLTTNKASRLAKNNLSKFIKLNGLQHQEVNENQNIYITSDEKIENCYYFNSKDNAVRKNNNSNHPYHHKIIITTDEDLIKEKVQAIPNEFLEWFMKNPSCEFVKIKPYCEKVTCQNDSCNTCCQELKYKIIIPKEELERGITITNINKQETLEEVAERIILNCTLEDKQVFVEGAKWLQEQIGKSEFLQKLRKTASDAEARRLIYNTFKSK